jgi:cytochrome P450 / NADPH-cytochrome P450 reductase
MRLFPPATARGVVPIEDTTLMNGKYAVKKGSVLVVQTICAQRDPKVWGDDVRLLSIYLLGKLLTIVQAEDFRPERLLGHKFDELPVSPDT